jgi:hypothetical protein
MAEYVNMIEVKRIARNNGSHWFDAGTMQFFDSRDSKWAMFDGELYWFVSSEQFHATLGGYHESREYTIRTMTVDGDINDAGGFGEHSTSARAWRVLRAAVEEVERLRKSRAA